MHFLHIQLSVCVTVNTYKFSQSFPLCLAIRPRLHEVAELSAAGERWQVDFKAGLFYCLAASAGQFQGVVLRHGSGAWHNHQI